jgi:hypothetical protein
LKSRKIDTETAKEVNPQNKHGVADQFLAHFSDHYTEKIAFSNLSEIYLQDYLRLAGD